MKFNGWRLLEWMTGRIDIKYDQCLKHLARAHFVIRNHLVWVAILEHHLDADQELVAMTKPTQYATDDVGIHPTLALSNRVAFVGQATEDSDQPVARRVMVGAESMLTRHACEVLLKQLRGDRARDHVIYV